MTKIRRVRRIWGHTEDLAAERWDMVEEVDREEVADMVGEERRVCDGRRFESSRETVRSAKSMPSFNSSPWILRAPP